MDFRGPIIGSLISPCTTSYRSSIATIALNCLLFEKIAFFCILATDRQTDKQIDEQMDSIDALSRSRCRERRLDNSTTFRQYVTVKFLSRFIARANRKCAVTCYLPPSDEAQDILLKTEILL